MWRNQNTQPEEAVVHHEWLTMIEHKHMCVTSQESIIIMLS